MAGNTNIDAIIIGAGVIGASVALGLRRAGLRTLNVDALPAAGYGSTSNSSAVIRPFYSYVDGCALAHESRHHWTRWAEFLEVEDERGFATYTECGILMPMAAGDEEAFAPAISAMDEVGVTYERLTPDEVEGRLPGITMQSFGPPRLPDDPDFGTTNEAPLIGGLLVPEAGYVSDPQLAAHNLQRAAEALGATFRFNTKVTAIDRAAGRVSGITTDAGETVHAHIVVNVAGPHSSKINALAGVLDDMRAGTRALRHEVAHVPAPPDLKTDGRDGEVWPSIADGDAGVYMRHETGNHMLIGTMDPAGDEKDYVDPDNYNTEFTDQWTRQVWRAAQRFPGLGIPNTAQGVIGLYDVTEDWVPIYDRSSLPGYYMAVGTSGNQFKNAPVIGSLMAGLITACEDGHDHDADPVQHHLTHLGRTVDIGFFSRLRPVSVETSGTVMA